MSKALFAQLLIRHRMVPPFVSVGGCVDQVRFFDADAEEAPRCSAGGADELERATKARHRAAQLEFASLQLRRSHKQPPLCASKLLGRAGVLLVSGADEGAAAATVFFTYVVNHALYADHHRLLPWVNLGWLEVPRVYDPKVHLQGTNGASSLFLYGFLRSAPGAGIWSHYFEPLENVALYEAHRSGRLASAPDDVDAGRAVCGDLDCAPRRPRAFRREPFPAGGAANCRDGNVVSKSLEWRHTIHRKALWAARAWYYGPKKRHAPARPQPLRGALVFDAHAHRHHDTNVEVLADILVLAHADVFVHAASAVAEAAQWLAFPRLHNRSVHLEFAPESQPHDAAGFAALAAATAPMVGGPPPSPRPGPCRRRTRAGSVRGCEAVQ
ncbi:hypothetical protein JL722_8457 [Aureococcus anophagefferens]|nr:hypothetical protein JL722_8457 [Aureococcus anophagefferens]